MVAKAEEAVVRLRHWPTKSDRRALLRIRTHDHARGLDAAPAPVFRLHCACDSCTLRHGQGGTSAKPSPVNER